MTLILCARIGILEFTARAWPLTMVCAYRQSTVRISNSLCVWEPGIVIGKHMYCKPIYIYILVWSTYVCLWHHVVSGLTLHPPCHQGQSVLRRRKALCGKCIRRISCYLFCLPVCVCKCVITIVRECYESNFGGQWFNTDFLRFGVLRHLKCFVFMVIINAGNFAASYWVSHHWFCVATADALANMVSGHQLPQQRIGLFPTDIRC